MAWANGTASIGMGRGNKMELLKTLAFPHSIGLLFSAFTYFADFRVNSGEYKLMGLAPYGDPKYVDLILKKLIDLQEDGSFAMDMRYRRRFRDGGTMHRITRWRMESSRLAQRRGQRSSYSPLHLP